MKNSVSVLLLVFIAVSVFTGCGGPDSQNVTENADAKAIESYNETVADSEAAMQAAMAAQRAPEKP
jgi:hypothetical protein